MWENITELLFMMFAMSYTCIHLEMKSTRLQYRNTIVTELFYYKWYNHCIIDIARYLEKLEEVMLGRNKENGRKRWETYRQLGKVKFIVFFALYFSVALTVLNFILELTRFGVTSIQMALVRFALYMIVSPFMAFVIWRTSEKRYS